MQNTSILATGKRIARICRRLFSLLYLKTKYSFYKSRKMEVNDEVKTVLFFLPELDISLYLDMLFTIASEIKNYGYRPLFFGCNGTLHNCMLMNRTNKQLQTLRNSITCANCSLNGIKKIDKENFDYLPCTRANKALVTFEGNSVNERLQYTYKGIPVGRLAYYDLSIKFKRDRGRSYLNENEMLFYDSIISDGINIVDVLDENLVVKSVYAVIAIDEYCHANIVREWARLKQVSSFRAGFSYHFNADPQFVTLSSDKTRATEKNKRAKAWDSWKNIPLPPALVKEISSDLIFRMSGSGGHIFSANYSGNLEALVADYNLHLDKKTLVAFTSANDEIDALAELSKALGDSFEVVDAFKIQLDWIKYIIDYAKNHDVQLIIKMHPRLSKSHRDTGEAEDIHLYEKLSKTAPDNVAFIWPKDNVSAYDILQLADICLTSWGTMGLEAAKLGVPVVSGITRITFATPQLALFLKAETVEQFDEMITRPLKHISLEDMIEAYRWHHLLHIAGSIFVDGKRDLSLYNSEFPLDFHNVLAGTNIIEEKYKFLSEQAIALADKAKEAELIAMVHSVNRLLDFFNNDIKLNLSDAKLVGRLDMLKEKYSYID